MCKLCSIIAQDMPHPVQLAAILMAAVIAFVSWPELTFNTVLESYTQWLSNTVLNVKVGPHLAVLSLSLQVS